MNAIQEEIESERAIHRGKFHTALLFQSLTACWKCYSFTRFGADLGQAQCIACTEFLTRL